MASQRSDKCPYGTFLHFKSADELMAVASSSLNKRTYVASQARYLKGVRAQQIKTALSYEDHKIKSMSQAFDEVDDGKIYKFELPGNGSTAVDSFTVVYANSGDTLVGAVFAANTNLVVAYLDDGDFGVCEPHLAR